MASALYIHVPFCRSICAYCDFTRVGYNQILADKWLNQIIIDLGKLKQSFKTIYIGGGTPNALSYHELQRLLEAIDELNDDVIEYTMEINVEYLNEEIIKLLVAHHVNRISLGVQSFNDELLKICNRKHHRLDIIKAIKMLHQYGIDNISIDLIYALPSQSKAMWIDDLKQAISLDIKHISLYSLTIEPHSYFGRNNIDKGDDELEADMYEIACSMLPQYGFKQYEISNFAIEGYESRHNLSYWHYDDFVGVGLGASGKENHCRYDNTNNFMDYLNQTKLRNEINLSKRDEMFEMIMMSLRLKQGLNRLEFKSRFNQDVDEIYHDVIVKLVKNDDLVLSDEYMYASVKGYPILNEILLAFLDE